VFLVDQDPIIITGCARSGTSLTAGIIHLSGIWGGKVLGPTPANPKGQFENREIIDKVEKVYLSSIGMDPRGQDPIPSFTDLAIDYDRRKKVLDIIKGQGYQGGPWYFKDAKAILSWPIWNHAFPQAKWVIVLRAPSKIAESCLRTSFMRAFSDSKGWVNWARKHHNLCRDLESKHSTRVQQFYPDYLFTTGPDYAKNLVKFVNGNWDKEQIEAFIDPALWHENHGPRLRSA